MTYAHRRLGEEENMRKAIYLPEIPDTLTVEQKEAIRRTIAEEVAALFFGHVTIEEIRVKHKGDKPKVE